ncbi:alpha/beta fold hydrolase [Natribacillus halophilus]|uniref:Pimeloyl-ACP methyl ester carboxylesterase n=1 Tax=Natribacillus halophilus TaxID=549003 RepID=A0A1G8PZZ2_9BACI|nr:alpha/beta hydrolase [Natribacillus halophilus]SDI98089.1 Pimeloyl-ACP methyl ester carboxylesterase [Natribacillus halophilus]
MNNHCHDIKHHSLERRGAKIHYWLTKHHSTASTVILTHGASLDHRMFDTQVKVLHDAGYRVLTWDVRGHGLSKPLGEEFTVQIVVEDLEEIIHKHELDEIILVGHSFGGYVSQMLTFLRAGKVRAMAVIGCMDIMEVPSFGMRIAYRNMSRIFRMIPESILRKRFAEGMGITEAVQNYALNTNKQLTRDEFIEVMDVGVRAIYEDPLFGKEYFIQKPFLLTHGEKDSAERGTFVKKAPDWAKRELYCQYKVIPNAGHNANQDNPDYFNGVLLKFIENLNHNQK